MLLDTDLVSTDLPAKPARAGGLRFDHLNVAGDLLSCCDVFMILSGGYLVALVHNVVYPDQHFIAEYGLVAGRLTLIAALLAPLMLRETFRDSVVRAGPKPGYLKRAVARILGLVAFILATAYLTRSLVSVPRGWLLGWCAFCVVGSIATRVAGMRYVRYLVKSGLLCERIAVVGTGSISDEIVSKFRERRPAGVCVVGVFDDTPPLSGANRPANDLTDLLEIGARQRLDWVIVADPTDDSLRMEQIVSRLKALDVNIALCPPFAGRTVDDGEFGIIGNIPLLLLAHRPIRHWGMVLKWLEDKLLALMLLVAFAPLLVIVGIIVALDSPGPVLFRQKRHGCNNSEFYVFKFRTMYWNGVSVGDGRRQTGRNDKRVTRIGRWLRASSIDELPQLFNVLRGDMSMVGPRPHPVVMQTEERLGHEIIAEYAHRHRVKPGITGLAQVKGWRGPTNTVTQVRERVKFDISYIDNWSLLLDLKILLLTPYKLIFDRQNAY